MEQNVAYARHQPMLQMADAVRHRGEHVVCTLTRSLGRTITHSHIGECSTWQQSRSIH